LTGNAPSAIQLAAISMKHKTARMIHWLSALKMKFSAYPMSSSWISMRSMATIACLILSDQKKMITRVTSTGMKATAISASVIAYI
jgi:hypothetical protein